MTQDTATPPQEKQADAPESALEVAARIDEKMASSDYDSTGVMQKESEAKVQKAQKEEQHETEAEVKTEAEAESKAKSDDGYSKREEALREKELKLREERLALEEEELAERRSKRSKEKQVPAEEDDFEARLAKELDADEDVKESAIARKLKEEYRRELHKQRTELEAIRKELRERAEAEQMAKIEKEFAELCDEHNIPKSKEARSEFAGFIGALAQSNPGVPWQNLVGKYAGKFVPEAEPKAEEKSSAPSRSSTSAKYDRSIPHASARRNGNAPETPLGREGLIALVESKLQN